MRTRTVRLMLAGVLLATVLALAWLAVTTSRAQGNDLITLPDGITALFEAANIPWRIYVTCDAAHHNLVYASATGIVVVKNGC